MTKDRIKTICLGKSSVIKLIKALDVIKPHGHDGISVKMIKICADYIAHPLTLIFQNSLVAAIFANDWKKANIAPIHKKNNKQIASNYRPVSLLQICSKMFEMLIINELFTFFEKKNLLSKHRSGFRPGDSCIYQLRAITLDICLSFDSNPSLETRGVFLDISKAFDRVWHDGLLFKFKQNSVGGNLLGLIKSFLSDRVQRVTLNGKTSD